MVVIFLFLALFISLALHISYLVRYIQTREPVYLNRYILTTVTNIVISAGLIFVALYRPLVIQKIKFPLLMWVITGFIMFASLMAQITIFQRAYQRSKLPEYYHYNFFGKKVLHPDVLKKGELVFFFLSMPVFLVSGAYFIAALLRFFI